MRWWHSVRIFYKISFSMYILWIELFKMTEDMFNVQSDVAPVLETDADGRLYFDGNRAGFSRFDRSYIAVAAKAFSEGRDIALVYPSPPTHIQIPMLLAVGFQSRSTEPVLFVSNRTGIRDQYFNLGLGPKFAPSDTIDPSPLGDATAPMVRTGDGNSLSYITHHKPQSWDPENPNTAAVVHTTYGKKIATTLSPDLNLSGFVLDFTTGLLDDEATQEAYRDLANERDIPRVMIFDSPNHPYLETLEKQSEDGDDILFWGWTPSALESAPRELLEPVADAPAGDEAISNDGGAVQSPFTDSVQSLENIRSGIDRSIVDIAHSDLQKVAKRAYERLGAASKFPRKTSDSYSPSSRRVVTNGYFLYMYLDTLPISVEFHDSLTSLDDSNTWGTGATLQSKVNRLREQASQLDRDVPGSGGILEEACDAFDLMIDLLTEHNPKADELVAQIRAVREDDDDVCVFTATRKQESLLRSFIAEKTEFGREDDLTENIYFHSLYRPHTVPPADVAVFPGVPTKSHYPTVQTGAVREQRFVTYEWEVARLKSRLADIDETAEWRVGSGIQHHTARSLNLETDALEEYIELDDSRLPSRRTETTAVKTESDSQSSNSDVPITHSKARSMPESQRVGTSPTLTDEDLSIDLGSLAPDQSSVDETDAWESELEFDDGGERETIDGGRTSASTEGDGEVQALEIVFSDGQILYEEPQGLIWGLKPTKGGSVKRIRQSAASLQSGDEVLLIEDDSRRDVFEHVVEKIHDECRGEFTQNIMMLNLWTSALDQMMDYWREMEELLNKDPTEPTVEMTERQMAGMIAQELEMYSNEHDMPDVVREPQSIRQYFDRNTIGPSDPETIKALGEIHDIESLQSHSREIHQGLQTIRRLHVRVGTKLEEIIFSSREADSDEWILKEAGLRVGDVQDATVVKRVKSVSSDTVAVQSHGLGKVLDGE